MDLAASSKYKSFHKGQTVFKEGQKATVAYMLKQGRVTLFRILHNKRVVLAQVLPGQVFGEEGLLTGQDRTATAEVDEPCELIVIDHSTFQAMLLKCPGPLQRMTRYLMEQLKSLHAAVTERPTGSLFMGVCAVIDLAYRVHVNLPQSARTQSWALGLSFADLSRNVKDILLVTQLEIDEVVARLAKLKFVELTEDTKAKMKANALGQMVKTADFLQDRYLRIVDLDKFLGVARNLDQEMSQSKGGEPPFTESLEFVDLFELARMVKSTPEMLYKKMAYKEVPENLFFFHKRSVERWAQEMGEDFFARVKRKRVGADELETVNDLVHVDGATLQAAFEKLGFHKLALLAAVVGEEAKAKILHNLSKKMAKVVQEEAAHMESVDDMEVADAEFELLSIIKDLKGLGK